LYEQSGYELVSLVKDFPSGTDVLWYRKPLKPVGIPVDSDEPSCQLAGDDVRTPGAVTPLQ
jgi:hypothetical protein